MATARIFISSTTFENRTDPADIAGIEVGDLASVRERFSGDEWVTYTSPALEVYTDEYGVYLKTYYHQIDRCSGEKWCWGMRPNTATAYITRIPPFASGDRVSYHGSLEDHHGAYTVAGYCECRDCPSTSGPRLTLVNPDTGRLLEHVSLSSVTRISKTTG